MWKKQDPEGKMYKMLMWQAHIRSNSTSPSSLGAKVMNLKSPCLAFLPTTENSPQAFGILLSQVISNDRTYKQRHDPLREGHSDPTELMLSFLHLTSSFKRANKELSSSNSSMSSTSETPNDSPLPSTLDVAPRTRRRVRHLSKHAVAGRQEICLIALAHEISLGICDFFLGMFTQWADDAATFYHSLYGCHPSA